ncbi:hypothetical protein JW721_04005 [Candidatus Micrarchaeota archaeon]|nr:hypothetical protein [Candidatus Micrarchaeota archaeon]
MDDRPEYVILSPCTTSKTIEMRTRDKIDLQKSEKALSKAGQQVLANTSVFLSFVYSQKKFMLYGSGKIVIKEVDSKEGRPLLLEVFKLLKDSGCMVHEG